MLDIKVASQRARNAGQQNGLHGDVPRACSVVRECCALSANSDALQRRSILKRPFALIIVVLSFHQTKSLVGATDRDGEPPFRFRAPRKQA